MEKEAVSFSLFEREKNDPLLLAQEVIIVLITLIAIPFWCVLPISGTPDALTLLIHKIIPCLLLLNIAISSVWDAREGMVIPWFFTINLGFFVLSCITQAAQISGPSVFFGFLIEDLWLGRLVCLSQAFIAYAVCLLLCFCIAFCEDRFNKPLCGAGDIKCMISFFFLPMQPDRVCQSLIVGLLVLLVVSLYERFKNGVSVPVRGLPWLYIGTIPALFYFY